MEYSEKQLQILDVAERLFASGGFDGTSIRDIAHEANVNVAMISYYFGSKEKLMQAVFEKRLQTVREHLNDLLGDKRLNSLDKVNILIEDYVERFMEQKEFHKIMMREQMINKDNNIACIIHDNKKRNMELIKKLIQEGQKSGEFRKNIDVMMMMSTLVGTLSHMVTSMHFYKEMNNMQSLPDNEFHKYIRKKVTIYLKLLFKSILTYEA